MQDQMMKIIKENLPAQTADTMREYIEEMSELKQQFDALKSKHDELEVSAKKMKDSLAKAYEELKSFKKREQQIIDSENKNKLWSDELDIKEKGLQLELTNKSLEEANNRSKMMFELVGKVFGHPRVTVSNDGSYTDENGIFRTKAGMSTTITDKK